MNFFHQGLLTNPLTQSKSLFFLSFSNFEGLSPPMNQYPAELIPFLLLRDSQNLPKSFSLPNAAEVLCAQQGQLAQKKIKTEKFQISHHSSQTQLQKPITPLDLEQS
jgi:hypothetical protein